jgi:glycosyltransferase involved in cell wall biosynthesis
MDTQPKISILLAVYNDEKYIYKSVKSIIDQTYDNWELLIGFNGTIDKSKDIVKAFNDERIKMFDYGDDKGKAKTLNKLIKEADGEWLAIQDGDDIWMPKKLFFQIEHTNDYDIIGTQIIYIDEEENLIGTNIVNINGVEKKMGIPSLFTDHEDILRRSLEGVNQIANTSAIFRKEKAIEVGGWDETIDGIEDYDFWLKMLTKAGCKSINLNKAHLWHRLHGNSSFNTKIYDVKGLVEKYKSKD